MTQPQALREAVDWLLRLESADVEADKVHAFEQWLNQAPEHSSAWQQVNGLFAAPLADLLAVNNRSPGQLNMACTTLAKPMPRRRVLGGGLAALVLGGAGGLCNRATPLSQLLADLHTGTGEHQRRTLADGSRVTLGARSAADIDFLVGARSLRLREGVMYLDVADTGASPFTIHTRDGQLSSQVGRLLVRQMPNHTLASVMQGHVRVVSQSGVPMWAREGQVLRIDTRASVLTQPSVWSRNDWLAGRADMRNEPLGELVQMLRPYHAGWLRVSPQAAEVPVYGSFLLEDLPRTLSALEETLPVSIDRVGNWFTRIEMKKA